MTKDEALKLALEALTNAYWPTESDLMPAHNIKECAEAITAIKEALANEALEKMAENARELGLDYEPAQEPVAWEQFYPDMGKPQLIPPQRTWVNATTWRGLTDDEILSISADCASSHQHMDIHFARAIQAKLKAKNSL